MIGPGRRQGEQAACPLPAGGGPLAAAKGRPAEEDGAGAGAGPCQAGLGTGRTAAGDVIFAGELDTGADTVARAGGGDWELARRAAMMAIPVLAAACSFCCRGEVAV